MSKKTNKKVVINQEQREKEELIQMKKLDPSNLKELIYQLREELKYLINEKQQIEIYMEHQNEKYMKDSSSIENNTKDQQEELTDLENKFKLLKNNCDEAELKLKHDIQNQIETIQKKKLIEKETIHKTLDTLTKKIEHLKMFKVRQAEYLLIKQKLLQKQSLNRASHEKDIQRIRNEHENKRDEVKQTTCREIQNIKQTQVSKLEAKMSREQQIKKENELMSEEIILCQAEKKILQEEYTMLTEESLRSQNSATDHLLGGQANETYERSLRVIKLESKFAKLKQHLQDQTERLDNQLKQIEKKFDLAEKEVQDRISKVQSWLKIKQKDIKKMKACAQMVLNQRSSLQSYLLQVFHEHADLDYKETANINQILRFLFIKINSRKPPISYKDYLLSTENSQIDEKQKIKQ